MNNPGRYEIFLTSFSELYTVIKAVRAATCVLSSQARRSRNELAVIGNFGPGGRGRESLRVG